MSLAEMPVIILIPWDYVQMIMPGPLFSRWFVALEKHNPITQIDLFHRERNCLGGFLNLCRNPYWQIIDVLKVLIGYDDNVSDIVWPFS